MSAATTRPADGNALDHQPAFIGPKWSLYKRLQYLRGIESIRCQMVVDDLLAKGGIADDWTKRDLASIVQHRALIARLEAYEKFHSDYLSRWRAAADAAGADLGTYTLPVEAAA